MRTIHFRSSPRKVAVVLGTRPETIKLAPLVRLLGVFADVLHTGQHYDRSMTDAVESRTAVHRHELKHELRLGGLRRGAQLGKAIAGLDARFESNPPLGVVVQGDTTSALAGTLAANANGVPVLHVEAGLRSFDRDMPEEFNRILIDHVADVCFAPTEVGRANLLKEGIPDERVVVTGNTVVEAVHHSLPEKSVQTALLRRFGLHDCGYVLATLHRPENVDQRDVLETILSQLGGLDVPVVLPLHPRTRRRVTEFRLESLLHRLFVAEPLEYPTLLGLACGAALIVSDSGGLQEEASVIKRPIVVVRRSTERPEIEGTFGIRVEPGDHLDAILREWLTTAHQRRRMLTALDSPYGDGTASERIVNRLWRFLDHRDRDVPEATLTT
jgi:UDP-N-acetylglucosamine 2-epimerase (non-hydrolysing)